MYTFKYFSKLQTSKFTKIVKKKELNILDFGCGVGTWSDNDLKNPSFKKITLYDKNKKLLNFLKKKYKNNKVEINFNKKKILRNSKKYDLVIFSSVVQYMNKNEFKKILIDFEKKSKKITFLIIDIPKYPGFLEFILLPFFNIKRFFFSVNLIFNKEYKKTKKYNHNFESYNFLKDKFKIEKIENLYDLRFLRYTLVIKKENC